MSPGKNQYTPKNYPELLGCFSEQELALISQLKRFFEWVQGDPGFCRYVDTGKYPPEILDRLKRIGISFDPDQLAILWKSPEPARQYIEKARHGCRHDLPQETLNEVRSYPLFQLWVRFISLKYVLEKTLRQQILPVPGQPQFEAWRSRRISSARSELGFYGYTINHPVISIELSDGCSIGCWFCAFAAHKLKGILEYTEGNDFFRGVAESCVTLFGKKQAGTAMLYCGTEPHDNPSYIRFVKDYTEFTGFPPFTSTAVAHDTQWLRELIAFYRQGPYASLRLSVLSKSMLLKIHELYSPEELRDVDLLMQMRNIGRPKVSSGRILQQEEGMRNREAGHYLGGFAVPQGSIECMSGFLVNMVNKTIKLISPCYSSPRWPYGFRIFDELSFSDPFEFPRAIELIIKRSMPESPKADFLVRFRDDLVYRPTKCGFDLVSPNQIHHFSGKEIYNFVGKLIARATLTYTEMFTVMMETYHINAMTGVAVVKKLFDSGLLDEVYHS